MTELRIPQMSQGEGRRLMINGRRTLEPEPALRFLVIVQLARGHRQAAVPRTQVLARASVSRIATRFRRVGEAGLYDRRNSNGTSTTSPASLQALCSVLRHSPPDFGWIPPTWARELLCLDMARQGYDRVAPSRMGRALARIGPRLGSPKPIVLCPWKRDQGLARLAEVQHLEENATDDESLLYEGEVGIHLNPKIARIWMLRGHQRKVVASGRNEKFHLAGPLEVRTGRLILAGAERQTTAPFCDLLRRISTVRLGRSRTSNSGHLQDS